MVKLGKVWVGGAKGVLALTPDGKWVYTNAVNLKSGFYATKVTDEKGKCDKIVAYS